MLKSKLKTVFVLLIFCSAFFAKAEHPDKSNLTEEYDPKPMIMHHVLNAHEWHLFDYKDNDEKSHPVSIPLPIILITDGNLDVFLSSDFKHGQVAVEKGNRKYILDEHGHIEEVNGASVIDISITKNVASMLISVLLLLLLLKSTAKGYKRNKEDMETRFMEDYNCLECEHFNRCSLGCFLSHDLSETRTQEECWLKEVYNYVDSKHGINYQTH